MKFNELTLQHNTTINKLTNVIQIANIPQATEKTWKLSTLLKLNSYQNANDFLIIQSSLD